ncbi:MAG: peptidoglycan-binding protein, partial [Oscillospiraceae bacterium]|nr:peptidoglycan-binding protein [Oscillospiraceae bacterium]
MLDDLKTLRLGDTGPQVSLLQLGLSRRGELLTPDGIFGNNTYTAVLSFQSQTGLKQDGIAGPRTWEGLMPWLTGYLTHVIRRGDTIYRLAQRYDTTISLLETANPGLNPYNLPIGRTLVIPLDFPVVPDSVPFTSTVLALCVEGLRMRFPFLTAGTIGDSVMGKPLWYLRIGTGQRQVLFNAAHHANEWITGPVVLRFLERYAGARAAGGAIAGIPAASVYEATSLFVV